MGGISKEATITGRTLQEAFKSLQESDREEHGNDIYSGGWNNSTGIREVSKSEFKDIYENDTLTKHNPAIAYCEQKPIKNTNSIKTKVESFPNKGTRKWETRYCAYNSDDKQIVNEKYQTEAIKKARVYVEKNPNETVTVHIEKRLEKDKNDRVAKITYKKSSNERDGVWAIYGVMSY